MGRSRFHLFYGFGYRDTNWRCRTARRVHAYGANQGRNYQRLLACLDYAFANTLTLSTGHCSKGADRASRAGAVSRRCSTAANSRYFSPSMTCSLEKNLDWTLDAQRFSGSAQSKYGRISHACYMQVQWVLMP